MGADTFSEEEKAAMKAASTEAKRRRSTRKEELAAADRAACEEAIAAMADEDRVLAERIHGIVADVAPELAPKTWYGMPAYARDGKVVVFFKPAHKFKSRYATLGFEERATLDAGTFWPTSYAVTAIDDEVAASIEQMVRRAMG
ncbi:iron chaperone [Demequina lignilytica]|uniref:YdhG-like domain-containing protein n=1 Tax=Demequina lignilytica TaxID=3051663 RepID=A0AB35MGP8_9MICO|nr:hypothetical protein [Demequina sp. SYSU T0a273]MDN4482933.1 hypothetical protein [Demequina sp. SYSU T0a273]